MSKNNIAATTVFSTPSMVKASIPGSMSQNDNAESRIKSEKFSPKDNSRIDMASAIQESIDMAFGKSVQEN